MTDWDHEPCPRCKYENARCACPKNVPHNLPFTEVERRALCERMLKRIEEKDNA